MSNKHNHNREHRIRRDNNRCVICNASPGDNPEVTLEVHHKDPNPDHVGLNHVDNLVTLCARCHQWIELRPDRDALPSQLQAIDRGSLEDHDIRIYETLAANGPMSVSEVAQQLHISKDTVQDRLYVLMGLDQRSAACEEQLVDQDAESRVWGLPDQIERSARGRIPTDPGQLVLRAEDELVRRALNNLQNREPVERAYGISERTARRKRRRAQAYQFPLREVHPRNNQRF